jgi:lipopolysaccharide export system permease protein
MTIITRYLIREFLKIFILAFISFIAVFQIIDFFDKLDNFMERSVEWGLVATYFLCQTPFVVQHMLPLAILLGGVITLSLMARNRELTALKSSGFSLMRLSYPLVLLSCCLSLFLFVMNETLLPPMQEKKNRIWQVEVQKKPLQTFFQNEKVWYRGKDIIYHIDLYEQERMTMRGITLYRFSPHFELMERLDARSAEWIGGRWVFKTGIVQTRELDGTYKAQRFTETTTDIKENPVDFVHMVREPEELNLHQLASYISRLKMEGYDATRYEVDLQAKISFPFASVIMMVVGVAMALMNDPRGSIAVRISISISTAFMYWVVFSICITSGYSGIMPPLVAAWLSSILFLAAGLWLLMTTRQ